MFTCHAPYLGKLCVFAIASFACYQHKETLHLIQNDVQRNQKRNPAGAASGYIQHAGSERGSKVARWRRPRGSYTLPPRRACAAPEFLESKCVLRKVPLPLCAMAAAGTFTSALHGAIITSVYVCARVLHETRGQRLPHFTFFVLEGASALNCDLVGGFLLFRFTAYFALSVRSRDNCFYLYNAFYGGYTVMHWSPRPFFVLCFLQ